MDKHEDKVIPIMILILGVIIIGLVIYAKTLH